MYSIINAPVRSYPYPHFYTENVFPEGFYREIISSLPQDDDFQTIHDSGRIVKSKVAKPDRHIITLRDGHLDNLNDGQKAFWSSLSAMINSEQLANVALHKFLPSLKERFGDSLPTRSFQPDAILIRDGSDYKLGPHSDAPHRALVLIFYLPETEAHPELGTSIYRPKNSDFRCEGGPHHKFEDFHRVYTAPYVPNSLFGFVKTANSFHGVEPMPDQNLRRELIHYFLRTE